MKYRQATTSFTDLTLPLFDCLNNPYALTYVTIASFSASIAAILGTMYRPTYPDLKCYIYCPPGCSVSLNLAMQCEEYVISIVVGSDVIPRIRGSNFEIL